MKRDKEMVNPTEVTEGSYKGKPLSINISQCHRCRVLKLQIESVINYLETKPMLTEEEETLLNSLVKAEDTQ